MKFSSQKRGFLAIRLVCLDNQMKSKYSIQSCFFKPHSSIALTSYTNLNIDYNFKENMNNYPIFWLLITLFGTENVKSGNRTSSEYEYIKHRVLMFESISVRSHQSTQSSLYVDLCPCGHTDLNVYTMQSVYKQHRTIRSSMQK